MPLCVSQVEPVGQEQELGLLLGETGQHCVQTVAEEQVMQPVEQGVQVAAAPVPEAKKPLGQTQVVPWG
jgi:hypothetical protein